MFCLATNEIAQTGLSSLPPVIYYSEQLFRATSHERKRAPCCNACSLCCCSPSLSFPCSSRPMTPSPR
ncbi:hypothetical protein E3D14_16560 [Aeromonas salmonicida subsp. salmonicida]|nr:hypothetical protein C5P03_05590 [Aeromonas salmonicida subsp. salmonicida 01-B526]QEO84867.1 hypothetical protein E3D14_16560 [Aeromonas salmonicida subsp. salmonicida]